MLCGVNTYDSYLQRIISRDIITCYRPFLRNLTDEARADTCRRLGEARGITKFVSRKNITRLAHICWVIIRIMITNSFTKFSCLNCKNDLICIRYHIYYKYIDRLYTNNMCSAKLFLERATQLSYFIHVKYGHVNIESTSPTQKSSSPGIVGQWFSWPWLCTAYVYNISWAEEMVLYSRLLQC